MANKLTQITCRGSPFEVGLDHGREAAHRVKRSIAFYTKLFKLYSQLEWGAVLAIAKRWETPIKEKWPDYYEEMRGVGEGSGVSVLDIVALNVRTEIAFGCFSDGCTSLFWKTKDHAFLGQNWDWMDEQKRNLIILDIQCRTKPRIQIVTEAGIIGKIGLNEAGVGVCFNAIKAPGMDMDRLPVHLGLRMALESTSAQSAVASLEESGMAASAHMLIADGSEAIGFEFTAKTSARISMDEKSRIFHANHLICEHSGVKDNIWLADSVPRQKRIHTLADQFSTHEPSIEGFSELFDDHEGYPLSICRYEEGPLGMDATVFNVVMDLQSKVATVRLGRPCCTEDTVMLRF